MAKRTGLYPHLKYVAFTGYDEGPFTIGSTTLRHHWSAFTGDWYHGVCDDCGWWGREVRTPDTARRAMTKHAASCKGAR